MYRSIGSRCLFLVLFLTIMTACNAGNADQQQVRQDTLDMTLSYDQVNPHKPDPPPQTVAEEQPPSANENAQAVAERLVQLANQVDDVNDATAVVAGRWAVVGIDVNAKLDRTKVGHIKYLVTEALRGDPHGAHAVVTADPDLAFRLRQMANQIQDGQPVEGILQELAAIVGRIIPEGPGEIAENRSPEPEPSSK